MSLVEMPSEVVDFNGNRDPDAAERQSEYLIITKGGEGKMVRYTEEHINKVDKLASLHSIFPPWSLIP